MAHHRVWQFRPPPGGEAAFAAAYAADGPWAKLFARDPGFIATRLLRPAEPGGWWLTIDSWADAAAFARFQADHGAAYRALDAELEGAAGEERFIGAFED
ncbi:antibiotic biosynthesis monooxygenase [Sphingomonas sp.]|uniref:antibiotic biosynthesis monooxygenase family protein n=1 Tax=Sphingomonas sp. TaxID=28214 RepID=UPI00286DAE10|nr:antibiotic biosynthesis monooxygenase [Sphingomonas sp.]